MRFSSVPTASGVYVCVFRRHQGFSCIEHSLARHIRVGAAVEAAAGASASPAVSPSPAPSSSFSSISMSGRVLPLPLSNISNSRSSDFSWDFHGQVQNRHYFLADMGGCSRFQSQELLFYFYCTHVVIVFLTNPEIRFLMFP